MTEQNLHDRADDNERLRRVMEDELRVSRSALADAAASEAETVAELQAVAQRLTAREAELETAQNELAALRSELADTKTRLETAEVDLAQSQAKVQELVDAQVASEPPMPQRRPNLVTRGLRKAKRMATKATRGRHDG